jgi:signal transduction histidine kinase/CheY-like chemotaxis protein
MHGLLRRQLVRHFGAADNIPAEWRGFISAVNDAYAQSDIDRAMLERSLELSSQELSQANSDMRAIFNVLPDLFFRLDRGGTILDSKAGKNTNFYVPPNSMLGKRIQDIPLPEIGAKFAEAVRQLEQTKSTVCVEYDLYMPSGITSYEARLLPLFDNEIIVIIRDITERKNAERELHDRESLLRATLKSTGDGILVVNKEGRATHSNARFLELWRIPRELAAQGDDDKLLDFVLDQLREPQLFLAKVRELYASREESFDTLHFKDERVFERFSCPLIKNGDIAGRVWSFRDITARVKAEQQQREMKDMLERAERMESLGVLAGGVAHDLNNILGPLVGYPDLIGMMLPDDSPVKEKISRLGQAAQAAADVVQDLLTLARRGRYELTPVNLNRIIAEFFDSPSYLKLAEYNPGICMAFGPDNSLPNINGSALHLSKVIMNLTVNAFEAMTEGGTLTISTSQRPLTELESGYAELNPGDYVILRMKDTGSGIDPQDLDKIFEPYYSKKKMGRSGSGLGLSVVYGVIKDHNGYYDVFSTLGKGTEFVLYFPVTNSPVENKSGPAGEHRGMETILVVDDNEEQRIMAAELIASLGYRVVSVANGHEAVAFFDNQSVDLVVLDMIMEDGFDGLDTYREIVIRHPGQKAIIVSGYSATQRVQQMQELGAGRYVRKPYSRNTIGEALREELDRCALPARHRRS